MHNTGPVTIQTPNLEQVQHDDGVIVAGRTRRDGFPMAMPRAMALAWPMDPTVRKSRL
jgi:hypothetical protein